MKGTDDSWCVFLSTAEAAVFVFRFAGEFALQSLPTCDNVDPHVFSHT